MQKESNSSKNGKNGTKCGCEESTPSNSTPGNSTGTSDSGTCVDSGTCSGVRGHPGSLADEQRSNEQPGTHDDHATNSSITENSVQMPSHAMPRDEALLDESSSVPGTSTMTRVGSSSNLETQLLLRIHIREKKDVEKLGEMVPVAAKSSEEQSFLAGRQGISLPEVHTEPPPIVQLGSLSEQTATALRTKRAEKQIATDAAFAELLAKKLKLSESQNRGVGCRSSPLRRKSKSISLKGELDDYESDDEDA